jgi:hypothetical protein
MDPAVDTLLAAVAQLEALTKRLRSPRLPREEFERLLQLADDMATARQLANYGVKL